MSLKDELRSLIEAGAKNPGRPYFHRLARGLTVGVKANDEFVSLQLYRSNVYPSTGEWNTVLKHWPEQYVVEKEPAQAEKGSRFYLIGRLRRTPNLLDAVLQ